MGIEQHFAGGPPRPMQERLPFIGAGDHVLDVESLKVAESGQNKGPVVWAQFRVISSTLHPVGSQVTQRFELAKQERFPTTPTQRELAVYFIAQLLGQKDLAKAQSTLLALLSPKEMEIQRVRGIRVIANGRCKPGKTWVNVSWQNVEQTPDAIKSQRAALDGTAPKASPAPAAPAPSSAPATPDVYTPPAPASDFAAPSFNLDDDLPF